MTSTSTTSELEVARARIRARLALAFVLDDVDVAGRAARLSVIVGATAGSTKPLDAAAARDVVALAARVELPEVVDAALARAGAASDEGRRLVRAVAWLEGRSKAHLCDVLATVALARSAETPVRDAVERALGGAKRAEWLASGIERALVADAARTEHATDAEGHLLYADPLGRPTTERMERVARATSRGVPLFAAPPGTGIGGGAPGEAYTEDELWQIHFHAVPHGEARLRDWTLDPLHRSHEERPRKPLERPAEPDPEVIASRAADLRGALAYADAARARLLDLPTLASHEPLFVERAAQTEMGDAARAAVVALGRVIATLHERLARLMPGASDASGPLAAPTDADSEAVPSAAWPLVFSLTGGPLAARIAAVRTLAETLPTGVAPAPGELAWPEPSIRDPVLAALIGSDLLESCSFEGAVEDGRPAIALMDVLEVVAAAQRTARRARRALASLSTARPALEPPTAEETAAASDEAALLATELVARSIAETARARFALWRPFAHAGLIGAEADAARRLATHSSIRIVLAETETQARLLHPEGELVLRLASKLGRQLGARRSRSVALVALGDVDPDSLETCWLALLRLAHTTGARVYTDRGLSEEITKLEAVARLVSGEPRAVGLAPRVDAHANVIGWALIDALDAWQIRRADVVVRPQSLALAQAVAAENALELRARQVRIVALAGDLGTANPIELTARTRDETPG